MRRQAVGIKIVKDQDREQGQDDQAISSKHTRHCSWFDFLPRLLEGSAVTASSCFPCVTVCVQLWLHRTVTARSSLLVWVPHHPPSSTRAWFGCLRLGRGLWFWLSSIFDVLEFIGDHRTDKSSVVSPLYQQCSHCPGNPFCY